jgi:flagellar hook-length control protein FliK
VAEFLIESIVQTMTPSLPFAGGSMAVASTNKPAAVASTASSSSAPASVTVDFTAMLGQLANDATPTSVQVTPVMPMLEEGEQADTEAESADVLGAVAVSLPLMPTEVRTDVAAQGNGLLTLAADATRSRAEAIAPEAQLLSELIQPEQTEGKFEIPHLPASNDGTSPLRHAEPAHSRPVQAHVGTQQWAEEIGARMTMMVEQGKHTASLRLSPEHLGPLEVRITVDGDKASVQFGASHVETRNALENALPRLREMFASQGLSLTDANVSREPPRQQANQAPGSSASGSLASEEEATTAAAAQVRLGLLDTYA